MRTKRGVVRIRQGAAVDLPWYRYEASWQRRPDDPSTFEEGHGWNDIDAAIHWARKRAPVVHVRTGSYPSDWYSAGEHDGRKGSPRWPGSRRARAGRVVAGYGGTVYVDQQQPTYWPVDRYSAWWESDSGSVLAERGVRSRTRGGFGDVEEAIDWGRERAPIVLVALLPRFYSGPPTYPTYEMWSAGEDDPPGEDLPRLRPITPDETMEWEYSNSIANADVWLDDANEPGVPQRRGPAEAMAVLKADPRAIDPELDRDEPIVRFRVRAAKRRDAEELARDVFLGATIAPSDDESYVWAMWSGEITPVHAGRNTPQKGAS